MSLCLRKLKKEAIKVELDKMTTNQITATDTEPTDCLSSFVAVLSPHCLDPKDLNTAIKPSHYPLPTMDDVTSRLTKAKVKLTENSSCRFRLLRMLLALVLFFEWSFISPKPSKPIPCI